MKPSIVSARHLPFRPLFNPTLLTLIVLAGFPMQSASQKVATVYSFTGQNSSGNPVLVVPAQARDGSLYGTTYGPSGTAGSIFRVTTSRKASQPYTFGSDGSNPEAGLTLASDGSFYGTTASGGSANNGVLFKVTPKGTYTVLHEFAGGADGAAPAAPPIEASDGNLYGTTSGSAGASTIYKYARDGSFSTLYNFDQPHGQYAVAGLLQGSDNNLYGTAYSGGASGCGTIFKLTPAGSLLRYYSFPCGAGGSLPTSTLIQASDGNFYGITLQGGNKLNFGTVFKLDQGGNVSILYTFQDLHDGGAPEGGLTEGTDGNLYGTTQGGGKYPQSQGTFFQLTTSGVHTILYSFGLGSGQQPLTAPMQHTNGLFYGTTYVGGRSNSGTVYSVDMGLAPFITCVRAIGKVGQTVEILGQGFTGATGVTFNGVPATSFTVVHDTYMTAVVPAGATTGPVVVTTPTGSLTSNKNFVVRP